MKKLNKSWSKKLRKEKVARHYIFKNGGFTLIELLAVIAIIGLITAILVVNLTIAKNKAKDSAIKASLLEVRNAAELYFHESSTYEGVCDTNDNTLSNNGDFGRIENFVTSQLNGTITCRESPTEYAVISTLNLGNCWCVDAKGSSREISLQQGETCADKLTTTQCP